MMSGGIHIKCRLLRQTVSNNHSCNCIYPNIWARRAGQTLPCAPLLPPLLSLTRHGVPQHQQTRRQPLRTHGYAWEGPLQQPPAA